MVYVTPGYQLVALNAETGRPIESFGEGGIVDLWKHRSIRATTGTRVRSAHNSPPTIASNVVIVPAAHTPLAPADQAENVIGYIRGFDVVTGKLLWTFHTVPRRGEPGYETWLDGSAETGGGNAGVWATISADEELGLAYLPVESPYGDMYGGLRPGAISTARASSRWIIRTGEYRWHFQTSHHPLWDYDIPTAPILVDAVKDGRTIKALAQATKQGLLFVLNRETGEPVGRSEETPCRKATCRANGIRRRSRSRRSLRAPGRSARRSDRLHARAARRGRAHRRRHRIGPIYTPAVPYNPNGPITRSWSWAAATGPAALTIPRRRSST